MTNDLIKLVIGDPQIALEGEVIKAVHKVGIDVDRDGLLKALKSAEFVDELIGYIFAYYSDEDYIDAEVICRKLYKHGLIDRIDGAWVDRRWKRSEE